MQQIGQERRGFLKRWDVNLPAFTAEVVVNTPFDGAGCGLYSFRPPKMCPTVSALQFRSTMV